MISTLTPGQRLRQAIFFAPLLLPVFVAMFLGGVFIGRANTDSFTIVLTGALCFVIFSTIVMGVNWRFGLYSIFFFIMFDRLLGIGETGTLNATKVAIGLTSIFLATAIANNQLPRWWERMADPLPVTAIAFLLVCAFSVSFLYMPEYGWSFVTRRFNIAALLIIVMIAVTDRDVLHKCILWFVIGGIIIAILTTSEAFTGKPILEYAGKVPDPEGERNTLLEWGGKTRLIGPNGDPTFYGLAQSFPGVLVFALFFYYKKFWQKALLGIGFGFIVFNILASGSRGGALSFVAGCLTVFLLCPIKHKLTKATIATALIVGGLFLMVLLQLNVAANRIASPTTADVTIGWRFAMWQMCWEMFANHPLTGLGINSWGLHYHWYRIPGSPGNLQRPLNSFLQILQETGIFGIISYTLLYVFAAFSAFAAVFATRDRRLKFEATGIAGVVLGFFLFAGTSNVLENELYFLLFGLCGSAYFIARYERLYNVPLGSDRLGAPYYDQEIARLQRQQAAMYPPGS